MKSSKPLSISICDYLKRFDSGLRHDLKASNSLIQRVWSFFCTTFAQTMIIYWQSRDFYSCIMRLFAIYCEERHRKVVRPIGNNKDIRKLYREMVWEYTGQSTLAPHERMGCTGSEVPSGSFEKNKFVRSVSGTYDDESDAAAVETSGSVSTGQRIYTVWADAGGWFISL